MDRQIYPRPEQLPAALLHVHADLVVRLQQDKRLRALEQQVAALKVLPAEFVRMDDRIVRAISAGSVVRSYQVSTSRRPGLGGGSTIQRGGSR